MPGTPQAGIHEGGPLAGEVGNEDRVFGGHSLTEGLMGLLKGASQEGQRGFQGQPSVLNRADPIPASTFVPDGGKRVCSQRGVERGVFHDGNNLGPAANGNKTLTCY